MPGVRDQVITYLAEHPGAHFSEILRAMDVATGTLQYHLNRMERQDLVSRERDGRYTRYYLRQSVPFRFRALAGFLRQPTPRRVIVHLLQHGRSRSGDIADALGVPASTLAFHLNRMVDQGVLARPDRGVYEMIEAEGALDVVEQVAPGLGDAAVDRLVAFLTGLRRGGRGSDADKDV